MFTGIIQEIGSVSKIVRGDQALQLTILAREILQDVRLGDSIAINGVCLTVTQYDANSFCVDVMPETYTATSLAKLAINAQVNLESALKVGGSLGGHFVTGHVDGTGEIMSVTKNSNAIEYRVKLAPDLLRYCIFKGSIAVDGTSLTIFAVDSTSIKLSLIPHTVTHTVLGQKKAGDIVNIESDMLAKYVERLCGDAKYLSSTSTNINEEFLQTHGVI